MKTNEYVSAEIEDMQEKQTGIRVCVIDDDNDMNRAVKRVLEMSGFETMCISESIGTSSKVKQFNPHIMLLDVNMPALNGCELLTIMRQNMDIKPITILFSGISPDELERLAVQHKVDDYVYKGDGLFRMLGRVKLFARELNEAKLRKTQ